MDKFWMWMWKNKYVYDYVYVYVGVNDNYLSMDEYGGHTKQMLVGYKIEFLSETKGKFIIGTVSSIDELDKELDNLIELFTDKR